MDQQLFFLLQVHNKILNLFGFFYAKVKTNDQYLGLLPLRRENRLIFPNGQFEGIWTSEELKLQKKKDMRSW
jgi:hypothetical protein